MSTSTVNTRYRLDENLTATQGRIFLTGTQALLRLLISQKRRDLERGLDTAGFVTGYRGSPLGGVDMTMWRHRDLLDQHDIRFLPAINEDLAATIVMGTQQAGVRDDRNVDGVFSMWYGKGPGVDRAGDALHHGNAAGASRHGGVLLIVGDDHTAASSSIPHASDDTLAAWRIPVVHPASVEEYERFGLWGWALSRHAGCWVAFKAITETVESGRTFELAPIPDFTLAADDPAGHTLEYSAREFLTPAIEQRMLDRLERVREFNRRHPLDRMVDAAPGARVGIISSGKAHLDTLEALRDLREMASTTDGRALPPLRHLKVGLCWPLDVVALREFAHGLDQILVIEEKSTLIEQQVKDALFNDVTRPAVCGHHDLRHDVLLPRTGQLDAETIRTALLRWLQQTVAHKQGMTATEIVSQPESVSPPKSIGQPESVGQPDNRQAAPAPRPTRQPARKPYFCSGCPHSTSTRVPEGSEALGGVGCHYMATWMDRHTSGLTQMGGEGADWIGLAPYTRRPHIFQNMGEGTYFHSGYLAIRQAIAAGASITYKILFNDAVAMTGGQPVDGKITVPGICQQLRGEGVERIVITTDDPGKYRHTRLAEGVTVHHRRELDRLQRELREIPGVTVLIHDQECAAEKRRRRKKGLAPDPDRRLFINTAVCEGCGDCGVQSNCLSLVPVETPFGRKRAIDQSSCNKDYRCVDGFCPSFVSVHGARLRGGRSENREPDAERIRGLMEQLPAPRFRQYARPCSILVAGVGGTGVVTVGAVLAMAAHLEGRAASVLDVTGLAQKGGSVISHVKISPDDAPTGAVRVHRADVAILCDPVVGAGQQVLAALKRGTTHTAVNTWMAPTTDFTQQPDVDLNPDGLLRTIRDAAGPDTTWMLDAHDHALQHFGDSIMANMLMLGFLWQQGGIPVSEAAIMQALELNGVATAANQEAFRMGRLAAHLPGALSAQDADAVPARRVIHAPESLEQVLERCSAHLTAYQNRRYAREYVAAVRRVQKAEAALYPDRDPVLSKKVAASLHKLMASKDEYEVARLFSDPAFRQSLNEQFEGDYRLSFHLAPPLLARRDPHTGIPRKVEFGPWLEGAFRVLAHGKHLRGTWLDVFAWTGERRMERRLVRDFRHALDIMIDTLSERNFPMALELAGLPMNVRGFGHVKAAAVKDFDRRLNEITRELQNSRNTPVAQLSVIA